MLKHLCKDFLVTIFAGFTIDKTRITGEKGREIQDRQVEKRDKKHKRDKIDERDRRNRKYQLAGTIRKNIGITGCQITQIPPHSLIIIGI